MPEAISHLNPTRRNWRQTLAIIISHGAAGSSPAPALRRGRRAAGGTTSPRTTRCIKAATPAGLRAAQELVPHVWQSASYGNDHSRHVHLPTECGRCRLLAALAARAPGGWLSAAPHASARIAGMAAALAAASIGGTNHGWCRAC